MVVVGVAPFGPFGVLDQPVALQALRGLSVHLDDAQARHRLGFPPGDLVLPATPQALGCVALDQLASHNDPTGGQVDVVPTQRKDFTASHPGECANFKQCSHAIRFGGCQEGGRLLGFPRICLLYTSPSPRD